MGRSSGDGFRRHAVGDADGHRHPGNATHFQTEISIYQHPLIDLKKNDLGFALSHYAGNIHVLGRDKPMKLAEIEAGDGAANTIFAGEVNNSLHPWGSPTNWRDPARGLNKKANRFGSPYTKGHVVFLFADGSVRTIYPDISPKVLKALSTPNGGEPLEDHQE